MKNRSDMEVLKDKLRNILDPYLKQASAGQLDSIADNLFANEDEYRSTLEWIRGKQRDCEAEVEKIALGDVLGNDWMAESPGGDIAHKSGGFFRIIGVEVQTDKRESGRGWKQPMLDQGTESSIAGFLRRETDSGHQYLVEAKFEPGNYGKVLISPSLQVTYSNLERAHGGRRPRFAELFDGSDPGIKTLYEQWLPEDGGRFYLKRVKYMIVKLPRDKEIEIDDNFRWVGVNTLKRLLWHDDLVNPHMRSLLAVL